MRFAVYCQKINNNKLKGIRRWPFIRASGKKRLSMNTARVNGFSISVLSNAILYRISRRIFLMKQATLNIEIKNSNDQNTEIFIYFSPIIMIINS